MMQVNLFFTERAVANHLWQSTLFLLCAAFLTLFLRKNQARIRYLIWVAASFKFLIPLSLLTWLGSCLANPFHQGDIPKFYFVIDKATRPFGHASPEGFFHSLEPLLLPMVGLIWMTGFLAVVVRGYRGWLVAIRVKRTAMVVSEGREVEALRRLQSAAGIPRAIPVFLSPGSLEPGVFGIMRPVLLWPDRVSQHLGDAHLEAVLAHEVAHVRRRDNLMSGIHMLVEAIYWFHPLVWWLGARLVEERERACDEAVLEGGSSAPRIYAESILKVCEFGLSSPPVCISGVRGGALRRRVVQIMSPPPTARLGIAKRLVLAVIGMSALTAPVVIGMMRTPLVRAQSSSASADTPPASAVAVPVSGKSLDRSQIYRVGGPVSAPKLTYAPDPEYTDKARKAKYQGVCVIELFVDTEGKPQRIRVVRHLGMGLDRKAIEAVKKYTFTPASLNGRPVPVQVNIEVNFRVY